MLIGGPDASIQHALSELAHTLASLAGPLSLVASGLQLPNSGLADLTTPRPGPITAVISRPGSELRILHHQVVGVDCAEELPGASADLLGIVRINASDVPATQDAISEMLADPNYAEQLGRHGEPVLKWVIFALARAGLKVGVDPVDGWPTGADAPADLPEVESDRIKLTRANRADDGAYSLLVLRRLSKPLTALAARRGWTPNAITLVSFAIGLAAAVLFGTGQRWALVLGAILLQVSLVVDCSDGEVARLTRQYSAIGAWLDASTDRVKEYAAYAGLAVGAAVNGQDVWLWACAALILQTTRHLGDYTFNRIQVRIETTTALASLHESTNSTPDFGPILAPASSRDRAWVEKLKKMIHLPIGERWLLISLTAAFLTPVWTFAVLIALGLLALAYTTLGRSLRCRKWPVSVTTGWPSEPSGEGFVLPQLDLGPLLSRSTAVMKVARKAAASRFGWALPSVSVLVELSAWTVIALVLIPAWLPAAYLAIFVIAFHRYDILYRTLAGKGLPARLHAALGGVDGRLLFLIAIALMGLFATALLVGGYLAADLWLGVIGVGVASAQWVRTNTKDSRGSQ